MAIRRPIGSRALRHARRAWNLLHVDSAQCRRLAEAAIDEAGRGADAAAEGWGRLALGFHRLYYATPAEAIEQLARARECFDALADPAGQLLACAGIARAMWREGRVHEALSTVLPLRDEGLRVLRHEQRGVLLNTIAGCYSALGDSTQAFAYMFEALRDAGPSRGRGFDSVLHCNLAHELQQIGDYEHALQHVDLGLARCTALDNARLFSVLSINRVTCLTELGRAADALPDIAAVLALPADASGRGPMSAHFETLAIAALRAGELALGLDLVGRAQAQCPSPLPDERLERLTAAGLARLAQGREAEAAVLLDGGRAVADDDAVEGQSLRMRAQYFAVFSEACERAGQTATALAALRRCEQLRRVQAQMASRARYQAAALQTELLRLQQQLDETARHGRRTERARADLAAANERLRQKVAEVESLQRALRDQATRDSLTGLFNRRHLNDTLPTLFALAQRDGQTMALVIMDLDHFKAVNDQHGHQAGDRLLAAFGELLSRQVRRSDVACRYGGEEFCLLLPRTDAEGARRKIARLLRLWRAQRFEIGGVALVGLSFSAGIADTALAPASPDALLRAADARLLAAKRAGRSRIDIATTRDDTAARA